MSWDLFVQDWGDVHSLDEIPADFQPKPIGKRSDFIERMQKIEPSIDFSDPSYGTLKNEHFSINFSMGDDEDLMGFAMFVRGDELSIPLIGLILKELNVRSTDGGTANFFDVEESKASLNQWREYRNQVHNKLSKKSFLSRLKKWLS